MGPPSTDPHADEIRSHLYAQLQELLAGLGGVPWLLGGIGTPLLPTSLLSGIGIVVLPTPPSPLKSMGAI